MSTPEPNPFQPPSQPSLPSDRLRPLSGLTTSVTVLFLIQLCLIATVSLSGYVTAQQAPEVFNTGEVPAQIPQVAALYIGSTVANGFFTIAGIVVFSMWIYRAAANADQLDEQGIEATPGWAVGWYFVPVLNLWKPYQVMKEIYIASDPDVDPDFHATADVPGSMPVWWIGWLVYNFSSNLTQVQDAGIASNAILVNGIAGCVSAVILVQLVRTIHQNQRRKSKHPML